MLSLERDMLLSSITSLANALEARDAYTRGHSESVAHIVKGMAEQAGISGEDLRTLEIAARLHDIGKIGISDKVLLKKGRLSTQEFDHIKEHPGIGARILANADVFKNILPTVLHHHEHYDGSGYPHGLKGEEIPFWARMTAVADAFDAMTSDRPYRHSKPISNAIDVIKEISGTQLCPKCVSLFLKWVETKSKFEIWSSGTDKSRTASQE